MTLYFTSKSSNNYPKHRAYDTITSKSSNNYPKHRAYDTIHLQLKSCQSFKCKGSILLLHFLLLLIN